ncbi:AprI/Inh family metalloprotease inhibitor [Microvirga arsenatis]|uniref:AprI/Inh family metalloprotease inhibitor n=1 Tax=Microvirga arsenatis TaxID=2692265 RepID=A0ABW9YZ08_9HYPH|nr:AprI/Inh family metalloprotease inhibitor [Microvirga arsenatis]NBJ10371.1 AprI/Inh family metalloprotease inhibitor [Microvirga arsenatis]NBJ24730.1 AprI/Inh family metalloprotease inhibitor [Microvirga arsenatis]
MKNSLWVVMAVTCSALALGACSSTRLGGAPIRSASAAPVAEAPPVEAVPSGAIEAAPLPPVAGAPLASDPMAPPAGGTDLAGLPPAPPPPMVSAPAPAAAPAPASRTAMVGNWSAQTSGGTCRIQLSSAPALDLYRASASGCSNQDLSKVNAWDYRDGEVYLYQTGGAVAARLRGSSASLSGVLAKSGAPLSLSR